MQFSFIPGHSELKSRLINSAREQRVSHALLFLGPEGSGSLPIALAFAQYLNCENPGETDSCGVCSSCIKMQKLVHPDVTFSFPVAPKKDIDKPKSIDFINEFRAAVLENPYLSYRDWMESLELENKQGNISVHESGNITNRLSLKSVEGQFKIVIIWYADRMNTQAANKLLKILEEPPEQTLFFLITENYDDLLATITSRTQLVKVNRLSDADITDAINEKYGIDKITARHIAHRSDGNLSAAFKIAQEDTSFTDASNQFLQWMRDCLKLNVAGINQQSIEFSAMSREQQKGYLQHILQIVRECLLINYGDRSMVKLEGKDLESLSRFAPFIHLDNGDQFIAEINKAHFHLERNANTKLLFSDLSFSLHSLLHQKAAV